MLGLGTRGSSDASNLWYVFSSSYCPFISFTYLVQATSISSSACLSRSCLIGWRVMANPPCCEDQSRTHDACNASLPVLQHSLFVLFPPEPPYTAITSFKRSNTFIDACMPHLDAGLAPTPLDHLRHNPRASSSLIDVHCRPSHCLPDACPPST